jgi:putative tricarboxylic transport membrane protein
MNTSSKPVTDAPAQVAPERPWWLAVAIIGIGAFWIFGASQLALGATHARVGPGVFVLLTGGGLVLLGLVLALQIARGASFEAQEAEDADGNKPADWAAFATAVFGASIPLYTMERFGFIVTAALMFAFITRAFGSRRFPLDLAIGAVMASVAWYGFSKLGVDLGRAWSWPSKLVDFLPKFSLT